MGVGVEYQTIVATISAINAAVLEGWHLHGQPFVLGNNVYHMMCRDKRVTQYTVAAAADLSELERVVAGFCDDGWEPHGTLTISSGSDSTYGHYGKRFFQPMIRKSVE